MAHVTVRLDAEDAALLDRLAEQHGSRSHAIRHALRRLAADEERAAALDDLLDEWNAEAGPVDEEEVAAYTARLRL